MSKGQLRSQDLSHRPISRLCTHENKTREAQDGREIPKMGTETESTQQFSGTNQEVRERSHQDPPPTLAQSSSSSSPPHQPLKRQNDDDDNNHSPARETTDRPQRSHKRGKRTTEFDLPSPPLPTLPHELIIEILFRLPAKILIKFRCVCKSFKSLISNPQFIKTHLKKVKTLSKNNPDFSQRIAISTSEPQFDLRSCSIYSIFSQRETDAVVLDYPLKDRYRHDWVIGSCDGLLCSAVKQDFVVLWNPCTRVFNRLPDLGFRKKSGSYSVFGFGYDSEVDDYKVVAVFCFQSKCVHGDTRYVARVQVCSLKTNYWRRIEDFGYGLPYDVSGKHVDGKLCWPVMPEGSMGSTWSIVAFDLAKETFEKVMQPDYGEGGYDRVLGVLDGLLCVMCDRLSCADIWVMKEYGMRESWTMLFCIPYLESPIGFRYSVPLCIYDRGEVLLEFNSVFLIYNPEDVTFRYPVINGVPACVEAEVYIESLASPRVETSDSIFWRQQQ